MRLKTYTAATTAEAMELVRQEMGDDAIIVSTQRGADGQGARVTAAMEDVYPAAEEAAEAEAPPDVEEAIRHALSYHGTPPRVIERLVRAAAGMAADDPVMAFAGALDALYGFEPLADRPTAGPTMLIGAPGVGKTITTAKLAARSTLAGLSVGVITTDTRRAGGVEQLGAFTRILRLDLRAADTVQDLKDALAACEGLEAVYVDTPGTNPFSDTEMDSITEYIRVAGAEPVLVMAAGGDAMEAADIAVSFGGLGARRLVVTRLDMARRLGSILSAADAARMAFANVSITPHVADGLSPINPVSLARLIMPDMAVPDSVHSRTEAER